MEGQPKKESRLFDPIGKFTIEMVNSTISAIEMRRMEIGKKERGW